jgi:hypothetical protein
VVAELKRRRKSALQIDVASLEENDYVVDQHGLTVFDRQRKVVSDDRVVRRGWVRRLAPPNWRHDVPIASHAGAVRASWLALLTGIARGLRIEWLTNLEHLFVAENKVVQHHAARALDIPVPRSLVTSQRNEIPRELGELLVVKPLGPAQFLGDEGVAQVLYTHVLARDAPELDALANAPFLVQERLEAREHLRIVTVCDRAWVCSLSADGLPIDWRRVSEAHDAFTVREDFPVVAAQALRLAKSLGTGYSSQDWVVTDHAPYFLDLNPAGQWLFLPQAVGSAVSRAIARWLEGEIVAEVSS